jgi:hypothetical protein
VLIPPLTDYPTTRRRFLALAEAEGATVEHHDHPRTGPGGEELATDVARFGPAPGQADTVVVVASGTHGVEGHAGSGLQELLLTCGRLGGLPPGVAVLLVHAVNPYGMAWSRRVDHENIDVNRNFVDFDGPLPGLGRYEQIDPLLNPVQLDLGDSSWQDALWAFVAEVGLTEAFRAITGGQYHRPTGMQFGGRGPSWSRRTLQAIWARHLAGAGAVLNLDVHTGLGPCGGITLFQTADDGEAAAEVAARWFPAVLRADRPQTSDPLQVGVLGPGLDDATGEATLSVPIVVEFGSLEDAVVLGAMRADNWLHAHGDPASELGERIRAATRDAFFVDDEGWRGSVAEQGMATIHAALDAAATRPAR